jgi:hypothetical protein
MCVCVRACVYYIYTCIQNVNGEVYPRKGHEGPEGE